MTMIKWFEWRLSGEMLQVVGPSRDDDGEKRNNHVKSFFIWTGVSNMEYHFLGKTGLKVSDLCFGALPMGPLQANIAVEDGGRLILEALQKGVNFIDTAELYATNAHIRWALERFKGPVILATKSTVATYEKMKEVVLRSRDELGLAKIDIFHLHAAKEKNPLQSREGALVALIELKEAGVIGAVGVSTHSVAAVRAAAVDPRIEVIFPLINKVGRGIVDGGVQEMIAAIKLAADHGKGLYAMKAFGGGTLIQNVAESLDFVRKETGVSVVAIGMIRSVELEMNLALFEDRPISPEISREAAQYRKQARVIKSLCQGCGHCVEICHSNAITMVNGQGFIDAGKCLMCGYCSSDCPHFAIRVI